MTYQLPLKQSVRDALAHSAAILEEIADREARLVEAILVIVRLEFHRNQLVFEQEELLDDVAELVAHITSLGPDRSTVDVMGVMQELIAQMVNRKVTRAAKANIQ